MKQPAAEQPTSPSPTKSRRSTAGTNAHFVSSSMPGPSARANHASKVKRDPMPSCAPMFPQQHKNIPAAPPSLAWKRRRCCRKPSPAQAATSFHSTMQSFWISGSPSGRLGASALGSTSCRIVRHFLPHSVAQEAADLSSHLLLRLRLPAAAAPDRTRNTISCSFSWRAGLMPTRAIGFCPVSQLAKP